MALELFGTQGKQNTIAQQQAGKAKVVGIERDPSL